MTQPPSNATAAEYIWSLRSQGWTLARIARAMDRSSDYISRIARGKTPGTAMATGLAELHTTGKVSQPPPRRTRKDGTIARVRSGSGTAITPHGPSARKAARDHAKRERQRADRAARAAAKAAEQANAEAEREQRRARAAAGRSAGQPELADRDLPTGTRNVFGHTKEEYPENGLEYHRITSPMAPNSWNRWTANETIGKVIRDAAARAKRMQANVIVQRRDSGQRMTVQLGSRGGYDTRNVVRDFASYQFEFEWLRDQIAERPNYDIALDDPEWEIVGVDIDLW